MGANGWVAGLVDAFPEETVAIYTYCKAGEWEKATLFSGGSYPFWNWIFLHN